MAMKLLQKLVAAADFNCEAYTIKYCMVCSSDLVLHGYKIGVLTSDKFKARCSQSGAAEPKMF